MKKETQKRYEQLKIEYRKRTSLKIIIPVVLSRNCIKCGKDIRFKRILEMEVPMYGLFADKGLHYFGCKVCFPNADEFYKNICQSNAMDEARWVFSAGSCGLNIREWAIMAKIISKDEADHCTTKELFNKIELI